MRLNSPLYDRTGLNVISEEVRRRLERRHSSSTGWSAVSSSTSTATTDRICRPPGYDAFCRTVIPGDLAGPDSAATGAPPDTPFYSDLSYTLKQYAAFGEATWHITHQWTLTAGLRYYKYTEDKNLLFARRVCRPRPVYTGDEPCVPGAPASTDSSGTSPRGIAELQADRRRACCTPRPRAASAWAASTIPSTCRCARRSDRVVFGNQPNWKDETTWNYEIGAKTQWLDRRVTFNIDAFYSDIKDLQATTTAGTCSSRVVFNVPTARSEGVEMELFATTQQRPGMSACRHRSSTPS